MALKRCGLAWVDGRLLRVTTNASDWMEVPCGDQSVVMNVAEPVAVVRGPRVSDQVVSWADLNVGARAFTATVMGSYTGAWVLYRPQESEDTSIASGSAAAVFVAMDGRVQRFIGLDNLQPVGATRHGLWLTSPALPDVADERAWAADSRVDVLRSDGLRTSFRTDRRIMFAYDNGLEPQLLLYKSAPQVVNRGWATTWTYRYLSTPLPTGDLPDRMNVAEIAREVPEPELMETLTAIAIRSPENPPIITNVRWDLISLSSEEQQNAVSAVLREFHHLANYWQTANGHTSPLSRGLGDPRLDVSGEWPNTQVHVSFTHPSYPHGRLRRTLRVFDDAGRIIPSLYASVHLMEDLPMNPLPDTGTTHPATLDI